MEIVNKGDIVCEYAIVPPKTPFGPMFKFSPDEGVLDVGASQKLTVTFCSTILGEFAEVCVRVHARAAPVWPPRLPCPSEKTCAAFRVFWCA